MNSTNLGKKKMDVAKGLIKLVALSSNTYFNPVSHYFHNSLHGEHACEGDVGVFQDLCVHFMLFVIL